MVVRRPDGTVTDPAGVPRHIDAQYGETLDAIRAAAVRASNEWPADGARQGHRVRAALRAELAAAGLRHDLVPLLEDAVAAVGGQLGARPVPEPPYVVVTSLGVVLRATLDDHRLVVELAVFEHEGTRYRLRDDVGVSVCLR